MGSTLELWNRQSFIYMTLKVQEKKVNIDRWDKNQTKKLFNSQRNERRNSTDGEKTLRSYASDKEVISMIY